MTDQELIELLSNKLPHELTADEVALLRARLADSPALAEALSEQLKLDQHLAEALRHVDISVETIVERASTSPLRKASPISSLLIWTVFLLVAGFVGMLVVREYLPWWNADREPAVAARDGERDPAEPQPGDAPQPPAAAGAADNSAAETLRNINTPEAETKSTTPTTPGAATPEAPKPWEAADQLGGPPRHFKDVAFDDFGPRYEAPRRGDFELWFKSEGNSRVADRDWPTRMATFDGRFKLQAPWPVDAALRFSFMEGHLLKLHFHRGDEGVTLQYFAWNKQWVAYGLKPRTGGGRGHKSEPAVMLATDDDRNWRTNPVDPAVFDVRCQEGRLVLSRGDVSLLSVPFGGAPTEVYFDGKASIRGLSLIRSPGLPELPPVRKTVVTIDRPADQKLVSDLPKGASLEKLPDGRLAIKSEGINQPAYAGFKIPREGLHEILIEVEDATPGARIYLGDDKGVPKYSVGFLHDQRTRQIGLAALHPNDGRWDTNYDPNGAPAPYTAQRQWVRLLVGAGHFKCWLSPDGVDWARPMEPILGTEGPYSHLGIATGPQGRAQSIKLRRVELRELSAAMALAPAELFAKARPIKANNLAAWLDAASKQQPPGSELAAWRRACALRTLASGTSKQLGAQLIDTLLDSQLAKLSPNEAFDLLDDMASLSEFWADPSALTKFLDRYEAIGQRLYRGGEQRPFSIAARRMMLAPLCSIQRPNPESKVLSEPLYRAELLEAVYGRNEDAIRDAAERLYFFHHDEPLVAWAAPTVAPAPLRQPERTDEENQNFRPRRGRQSYRGPQKAELRHPLIEEISKEGYNVLAEFEAALASKAYRDACQIIAAIAPGEALGVLPNSRDPDLLVSLEGAVSLALQDSPELRQTMIQEFGKVADLRLKQAMAAADELGVQAVSVQFQSTEAAAEAHRWLGDRVMAAGDFGRAKEHYRLAARNAGETLRSQLAARQRLAAAMLGADEGSPVTATVEFGDAKLPAAEFEALVAEMRARPGVQSIGRATTSAFVGKAPAATAFDVHSRDKLDGEWGDAPGDVPADNRKYRVDWAGRQTATAVEGDVLYVSNRFQVSAFDLSSGKRKWQTPAGSHRGKAHEWTLTPMRPLVAGDKIFVRQLMNWGPELRALNAADGEALETWKKKSNVIVASDPLLVHDRLLAITVLRGDGQCTLSLASFDPATGGVLSQQRLLALRDSWWQQRTCQLTQSSAGLLVSCGGTVIACDLMGKLRWVRKTPWLPSPEDRGRWVTQLHQPPLAVGDRLYVAQPGVRCVDCLDSDTGRLHWRKVLPGVRGIVGHAGEQLLVATDEGFLALATADGALRWRHDDPSAMQAELCDGPGGLLYARRETVKDKPEQGKAQLVWLDPAQGVRRAVWTIDALKQPGVMISPLVSHREKLWAFAERPDAAVRELYEFSPTQKLTATENGADPKLVSRDER